MPGIRKEEVLIHQMGCVREETSGHPTPLMQRELQGPKPGDETGLTCQGGFPEFGLAAELGFHRGAVRDEASRTFSVSLCEMKGQGGHWGLLMAQTFPDSFIMG